MARPKRNRQVVGPPPDLDFVSTEIRPLTAEDWPVVERLFGPNGACGGCWCMLWRVPRGGKAWEAAKGEPNRLTLRALVEAGNIHSVLAFSGTEPVGWCSFGPSSSFPKLMNSRALQRPRSDGVWSVVCFYIPARFRGHGLGTRLLVAAADRAFELGCTELEGFPAAPSSSGRPLPGAFAWTGVPAMFEAAGFRRLPRPGSARRIYVSSARDRRRRG